ncbi:aminotransferase-like domain-containing protein [Bacillus sp. 2205SS5-2]|uniref:aminotransferase-like domain-containing protein n=1 Tax=Bacillus sp. 2205SS5-2 TaxID=3109031 RepID=UPI003003B74A
MLKYESIGEDLRYQITIGDLKSGAKLPSIRNLAQSYSCSKSTILTALKNLEDQHLIYSMPKSGYYVVDNQAPHKPSTPDSIDFATSSPTWHAFPYNDFLHCVNKAIDTYQEDLFRYGTPRGLSSLLTESKKLLEKYQVFTNIDNIFITAGVQRALSLLSVMPFPNNRTTILVEQPSYHLYMDFLKTYQLQAVGIKRTTKGIDLEELERIFRQGIIKFFYTMPRFHNPLGTSYSKKEKESILQLAHKYDVYIVEDDYLADFEQNPKIDPLFTKDVNARVIYVKSFSKIMFPGLRIGLAVLPNALKRSFQQFINTTDIDSSMISQAALEIYLKSGMFERYRAQVSQIYTARAKILQRSLETHLPMYEKPTEVTMNSHILLPKQVDMKKLIHYLTQKRILLESIDGNYLEGFYRERLLKLHISNVKVDKIEVGIKEISRGLENVNNYFR